MLQENLERRALYLDDGWSLGVVADAPTTRKPSFHRRRCAVAFDRGRMQPIRMAHFSISLMPADWAAKSDTHLNSRTAARASARPFDPAHLASLCLSRSCCQIRIHSAS